jgi:hypothetical protein
MANSLEEHGQHYQGPTDFTCLVCGDMYYDEVDFAIHALGHTYSSQSSSDLTCFEVSGQLACEQPLPVVHAVYLGQGSSLVEGAGPGDTGQPIFWTGDAVQGADDSDSGQFSPLHSEQSDEAPADCLLETPNLCEECGAISCTVTELCDHQRAHEVKSGSAKFGHKSFGHIFCAFWTHIPSVSATYSVLFGHISACFGHISVFRTHILCFLATYCVLRAQIIRCLNFLTYPDRFSLA